MADAVIQKQEATPNLLYLLIKHFNLKGWLALPGIGLLKAKDTRASINYTKKQVLPTERLAEFDPYIEDKHIISMVQNWAKETGFPKELLQERLSLLSYKMSQKLIDRGILQFDPFGSFKLQDNKLVFVPGISNIHEEFIGSQPIDIKPLQTVYKKEEVERTVPIIPMHQNPTDSFLKSAEFKKLLLGIGIAALAVCLLVCFPRSCKQKPVVTPPPITSQDSTLQKEDSLDALVNKILQGQTPKDSLSSTIPADTANVNSEFKNETEINANNVDDLNAKVANKKCIIIVGSFKNINYANRMERKIIRNGEVAHRERYNEFRRIGIRYDCLKVDLKQKLEELKKEYDPNAWILKY